MVFDKQSYHQFQTHRAAVANLVAQTLWCLIALVAMGPFILHWNELEGSTSLQLRSPPVYFGINDNHLTGSLPHQPAVNYWRAGRNSFAGAISEMFLHSMCGVRTAVSVDGNQLAGA
eukprot:6223889-Amphidinium_carterae.1